EVLHPAGALMSDLELERHLATPATQYAIVEDALAHHDGLDRAALRRRLGDLWAGFAEVAAANPNAWNRAAPSGEEITGTAGGNRMVAEPYTRSLCSQWNVDAASAVVIASEGLADRLGLDPRRCVPVEATAESNLIVPLPQRAEPDRWPAFEAVIAALAAHLDVPVDGGLGADVVDLYACFPSAVQVQARALGLPIVAESLTATGGMTFAGGPLNNAALASTVAVVERLRSPGLAETAARGLVTSISGMLTKPGAMTLRSGAAAVPFVALDVTAEATRRTGTVEVSAELAGPAVVVGATVVPTFEGGDRVVALVRAEGRGGAVHSVATSERAEEVERVRTAGGAGTAVVLDGVGGMRLAAGPSGPEVALRSG
ncbi:MAG: hypothetical protein KDB24_16560, partial [Microthrixaceae bacterium]|nr:hypothetical protein [Microthrixaceae bacterium]